MKKIFVMTFIFIITIALALFLNIYSVNAANNAVLNLKIPSSAKRGDTVKAIISVSNSGEGINGVQGKLQYDKNVLEYVNNTVSQKGWTVTGFNKETGMFLIETTNVGDKSTYLKGNNNIVELEFKVKSNANLGSCIMTISNIVLSGATITNPNVSASINIIEVNDSKNVNKENDMKKDNTKNEQNVDSQKKEESNSNANKNNNEKVADKKSNDNTKNANNIKDSNTIKKLPYTGNKSIIPVLFILFSIVAIFMYKKIIEI